MSENYKQVGSYDALRRAGGAVDVRSEDQSAEEHRQIMAKAKELFEKEAKNREIDWNYAPASVRLNYVKKAVQLLKSGATDGPRDS